MIEESRRRAFSIIMSHLNANNVPINHELSRAIDAISKDLATQTIFLERHIEPCIKCEIKSQQVGWIILVSPFANGLFQSRICPIHLQYIATFLKAPYGKITDVEIASEQEKLG